MDTITKQVQKVFDKYGVDFAIEDYYSDNELMAFDNGYGLINDILDKDIISEISEVIGYDNAMAILSKDDPSLQISMGIAEEIGTNIGDITSEILAALLSAKETEDNLYKCEKDLDDVFENSKDLLLDSVKDLAKKNGSIEIAKGIYLITGEDAVEAMSDDDVSGDYTVDNIDKEALYIQTNDGYFELADDDAIISDMDINVVLK